MERPSSGQLTLLPSSHGYHGDRQCICQTCNSELSEDPSSPAAVCSTSSTQKQELTSLMEKYLEEEEITIRSMSSPAEMVINPAEPYGEDEKSFVGEQVDPQPSADTVEKPYSCDWSYSEHPKSIHPGEEPYTCNQCGKFFRPSGNVKVHRRTHTGEDTSTFDQCGKSFSNRRSLERHQRTHTGERPYTCEECERSFAVAGNLRRHQQIHTGEKPYTCNLCRESFARSENLKRHQQTHTGEKPFTCEQCWKTFTRRENLQIHQSSHVGEQTHTCKECGTTFSLERCVECVPELSESIKC